MIQTPEDKAALPDEFQFVAEVSFIGDQAFKGTLLSETKITCFKFFRSLIKNLKEFLQSEKSFP